MTTIKSPEEIEKMKRGGVLLAKTMSKMMAVCEPGVRASELNALAIKEIERKGGRPSFLNYQISDSDPPYPSAVCVSVNDEVVHGLALPEKIIKEGDLVSLDIGMWYEGMATDMAATVCVGKVEPKAVDLSRHTKECLKQGLSVIKEGAWVHEIGQAIENYLKPFKYGIIKDLCGHGVGHAVHEDPQIPNYHERRNKPIKLKAGMCIAIEPMITLGGWRIKQKDDGWTILTADGSLSAHWEVTVVVTKSGFEFITPWPEV